MTASDANSEALAELYNLGLSREHDGDIKGAIAAYRQALALDESDPGGVSVRLAALGAGPAPDSAPPAYVEMLFDQHAESFEEILVDRLDYHVPRLIREKLDAARTDAIRPPARSRLRHGAGRRGDGRYVCARPSASTYPNR